jgi:glutathione synthase/RimK-type ligase-like ATP-grasp enzyme
MIVVWGSVTDPPVELVTAALAVVGAEVTLLDNAALAALQYDVSLARRPSGWLHLGGRRVVVDELRGMYARPTNPAGRGAIAATMMAALASSMPGCVVNRPVAGRSNWSKPFQLSLLAGAGFLVPDTLVTTDRAAARGFLARHRRIVYKSVSGIRSIVATIDDRRPARLDDLGAGPVQFQQWIDGVDIRVHVVGDRWFATEVASDADDYRYPTTADADLDMRATDIPPALGCRLVELTRSMGLVVSGIDLRRTPEGEFCLFEVNPSPGFSFYEEATGQPIAAAIADLLTGRVHCPEPAPSLRATPVVA